MDITTRNVLSKIYDATICTADGYAVCVTIDIRSDSRKNVCSWLENNGYITRVDYIGQDKVRCQITEKTRKFFADLKENRPK